MSWPFQPLLPGSAQLQSTTVQAPATVVSGRKPPEPGFLSRVSQIISGLSVSVSSDLAAVGSLAISGAATLVATGALLTAGSVSIAGAADQQRLVCSRRRVRPDGHRLRNPYGCGQTWSRQGL